MGKSYGYGFNTKKSAKAVLKKLKDKGHEVGLVVTDEKGERIYWVRDFGKKENV